MIRPIYTGELAPETEFDSECKSLSKIHKICYDNNFWKPEVFQDMLSGNRFFGFVATDTKIDTEQKKRAKKPAKIGFIMARMTCDEVEIITFCVLPEYRNMGVGKSLLEELHRHVKARGATLIFLEVAEDNAAAIKLYHNMGYKRIALRIKYYCSGGITRDAIVMRLCFEVV